MASGQTSNYGLNQWAAEDPVLREAFNQDNTKVDMIMGSLHQWGIPELLKEETTIPQGTDYTLRFSDIDWSNWREVWIDATLCVTKTCTLYLDVNGYSTHRLGTLVCYTASDGGNGLVRLIFYPLGDPKRKLSGLMLGNSSDVVSSDTRFSGFSNLYYGVGEGSLLPECSFRIWGLRAPDSTQ